MSKLLKLVGVLCYAILIYSCFLFPFTLNHFSFSSKEFLYGVTFGGVVLTLASCVGNCFMCYVLLFGFNTSRPLDFLLVSIAIGDIVLPLLQYPMWIAIMWTLTLSSNIKHLRALATAMRFMSALSVGCITFSFMCIAFVFILRLYTMVKRQTLVPKALKFITVLVSLTMWVVVSLVMLFNDHKDWAHAFLSCMALFLPLSLVVVSTVISKRFTHLSTPCDEGQKTFYHIMVLSYVLYWTPWFITQMMHQYCCEVEYQRLQRIKFFTINLIYLKCCTNIFLALLLDQRFLYTSQSILTNFLPAVCRKQENVQFELEDFSLRYSSASTTDGGAGADDVANEELNDEQALITTMQEVHLDFTTSDEDRRQMVCE